MLHPGICYPPGDAGKHRYSAQEGGRAAASCRSAFKAGDGEAERADQASLYRVRRGHPAEARRLVLCALRPAHRKSTDSSVISVGFRLLFFSECF